MNLPFRLIVLGMMVLSATVQAAEPLVFSDPAYEQRYIHLTQELRCLVCQNQNLADSDAPLAQDLRQEIHQMMESGKSNAEIKTFMVERYGDFVLYRPQLGGNTLALWVLPALLLLIGALTVVLVVRRYNRLPPESPNGESR